MFTPETIELARKLYVQTRSLERVWKELKRQGYNVSKNTLKRWKAEYKFKEACRVYDEKLKQYNDIALEIEKEILLELYELRQTLKDQIKQNPGDSQLIYSYLGVLKQIQELKRVEKVTEAAVVDKVIDLFLTDKVIGPVLQSRKAEVMRLLEKWKRGK